MRIIRWFVGLLVLVALAGGVAYFVAGNADGPVITINQPAVIGQSSTLDVAVGAPGADLSALTIQLDQKGRTFPILEGVSTSDASIVKEDNRVTYHAADRQECAAGARKRPGNSKGDGVATGTLWIEACLFRSIARR